MSSLAVSLIIGGLCGFLVWVDIMLYWDRQNQVFPELPKAKARYAQNT